MTKSDPEPFLAESPEVASDPRQFVLKNGDMFMVGDAVGNVTGPSDGFFYNDTRVLSTSKLCVGGRALSLLGAAIGHDNITFQANLTNKPCRASAARRRRKASSTSSARASFGRSASTSASASPTTVARPTR